MKFTCCNREIKSSQIWLLFDIKEFTGRKIIYAVCPFCGKTLISLIEKRKNDGKIFISDAFGDKALKILMREKKRLVIQYNNVAMSDVMGWIYGVNIEIKNKKGVIKQIRQYSADFQNNKKLSKRIIC